MELTNIPMFFLSPIVNWPFLIMSWKYLRLMEQELIEEWLTCTRWLIFGYAQDAQWAFVGDYLFFIVCQKLSFGDALCRNQTRTFLRRGGGGKKWVGCMVDHQVKWSKEGGGGGGQSLPPLEICQNFLKNWRFIFEIFSNFIQMIWVTPLPLKEIKLMWFSICLSLIIIFKLFFFSGKQT